ncbi:MAG: hypothetical protein ABUL62_27730 [Myxococcales bacterium]
MPRCHLARTLCALCALLGSFAACGARTALDTSDYLPNVAGATSSNAGARAGGPSIDPEVCARFAPLWDSRAGATTLTCDTCLRDVGCGWPSDSVCLGGTRCVDRRCSVLGNLSTLCACIEGCFTSDEERVCDARWSTFMTCATTACKVACP